MRRATQNSPALRECAGLQRCEKSPRSRRLASGNGPAGGVRPRRRKAPVNRALRPRLASSAGCDLDSREHSGRSWSSDTGRLCSLPRARYRVASRAADPPRGTYTARVSHARHGRGREQRVPPGRLSSQSPPTESGRTRFSPLTATVALFALSYPLRLGMNIACTFPN